ncbi:MAG: metallophosphoesterase family protein [Planctomycetes bacterium]|nr:metallophosphoesterase family protein [Planctomycetota bacterium]
MRTAQVEIPDEVEALAVVSDVHGCAEAVAAFEVLRESLPPHRLAVNGDLVMGGLEPATVVEWALRRAPDLTTRGNHDAGLLAGGSLDEPAYTEGGSYARLSDSQRRFMTDLPDAIHLAWRGRRIRLIHGHVTAQSDASGCKSTPADLIERFGSPEFDLTCLGHTHFPFAARGVANSGSLAQTYVRHWLPDGSRYCLNGGDPRFDDRDTRPSYLLLRAAEGVLRAEVRRFDFDRTAAWRRMAEADPEHAEFWRAKLLEGSPDARLKPHDVTLARPWR